MNYLNIPTFFLLNHPYLMIQNLLFILKVCLRVKPELFGIKLAVGL